jgi:hypothetical protein
MAFSPTDPVLAHSLWLQLRSSRRRKSRRHRWRSDWTPLWIPLLLISILAFGYVIMLSIDRGESVEQSAQKETVIKEPPVLGVLAGQ